MGFLSDLLGDSPQNLLQKALPPFAQELFQKGVIIVPADNIRNKVGSALDKVEEVQNHTTTLTDNGINIEVSFQKLFISGDTTLTVVLDSVNLANDTLHFTITDIKVSGSNFISEIILSLAEEFIINLLEEKVGSVDTDEITVTKDRTGYLCDFSGVKTLSPFRSEIPLINKSLNKIISISQITHKRDGIHLKLNFEI